MNATLIQRTKNFGGIVTTDLIRSIADQVALVGLVEQLAAVGASRLKMEFVRPRLRGLRAAVAGLALLAITATAAGAQSDADELAKKLANPVASLISMPFQFNYDTGIDPDDEGQFLLNIQPVVPFGVGPNTTFILRSIIPVADAPYGVGTGIGDVIFQGFFSPQPKAGGPIWGLGPVVSAPTASKDALGTEKWSAGAAGVILRQQGPWTYGILAMNFWSVAGSSDRADVNAGLYQPFLSRSLGGGWTVSTSIDAAVNWNAGEKWTIPLIGSFSKVLRIGSQNVSVGGGLKYYLEAPQGGLEWGARFNFVLLFPR